MLSGGQRARVALARALYAEPDSLYLEDIFAAVDQPTAATLWGTLCELHAFGVTIVLATNQARSGPLMAPDDDD
jgi:putative ABC transport system ATP-binding protein